MANAEGRRWREDAFGWPLVAIQGVEMFGSETGIDKFISLETVSDATRAFERQQAAGQWNLYGHWRGIVLNIVTYGKQEQR
jgi:hypothetical protein